MFCFWLFWLWCQYLPNLLPGFTWTCLTCWMPEYTTSRRVVLFCCFIVVLERCFVFYVTWWLIEHRCCMSMLCPVLQYRVSDWKQYLLQRLIGANTLQPSVHVKAKTSFQRCPLQPGMWLEVVDRTCLSVMTVATVDRVVGGRMRLRYLNSEVKKSSKCCLCSDQLR